MLIVIHYEEIALKGKNRSWFEKKLAKNIDFAMKDIDDNAKINFLRGRFVLKTSKHDKWEEIKERLSRVSGISSIARAYKGQADIEKVKKLLDDKFRFDSVKSFAVRVKRADKSYKMKSPEIERELGAFIYEKSKLKVDLTKPDVTIYVEWLKSHVIVSWEKHPCIRGLPLGVSGTVACLLSGGIDSPVAVDMMMRRGCTPCFIHFHSFPFTDSASQEKVKELAQLLCKYRYKAKLFMVPFSDLQKEIVVSTPSPYRVILYRRFMIRIAEKIAHQENIGALVTGESLAQVASQTLTNLATINSVVNIPILRPLIGMPKLEIINRSKEIGTYELSIEPHGDCCSFLMPRFPKTHSSHEELIEIEKELDVEALISETMKNIEVEIIEG